MTMISWSRCAPCRQIPHGGRAPFRVSDTNRNAALNLWGKRVMRSAMLSCAFASAILSHTAFLSQNAVAGSSEAGQIQTSTSTARIETRPEYRSGRKNRRGEQKLPAEARSGRPRARCLYSPPQQEPRRAKKLPSPRSTRRPSPSIPPLRNVANAISRSTKSGLRRSTPMRRSRRCSTRSSRSSRS